MQVRNLGKGFGAEWVLHVYVLQSTHQVINSTNTRC